MLSSSRIVKIFIVQNYREQHSKEKSFKQANDTSPDKQKKKKKKTKRACRIFNKPRDHEITRPRPKLGAGIIRN